MEEIAAIGVPMLRGPILAFFLVLIVSGYAVGQSPITVKPGNS